MSSLGDSDTLSQARDGLRELCDAHGIDASHGVHHAQQVLAHADAAVDAADPPLAPEDALAVRLAALLHDADDRKYFPSTSASLANAAAIMRSAGVAPAVADDALAMIRLVSCSSNGNSVPREAGERPWILWPRWADRLEATGAIGVVRCFRYNQKLGAPLFVESTPRPASAARVWELATEERFAAYQSSGGESMSMLDHFFDKLLQVSRPPPSAVRNRYLESEASARCGPLLEVLLAFGSSGSFPYDIVSRLESECA
jgi:uncharacterized protein